MFLGKFDVLSTEWTTLEEVLGSVSADLTYTIQLISGIGVLFNDNSSEPAVDEGMVLSGGNPTAVYKNGNGVLYMKAIGDTAYIAISTDE